MTKHAACVQCLDYEAEIRDLLVMLERTEGRTGRRDTRRRERLASLREHRSVHIAAAHP